MDPNYKVVEIVLRRILNDGGHDFLLNPIPPATSFRPTNHDVDGISVSLKSMRTPQEEGESGRNPKGYFVAEVTENLIYSLGLTLAKRPIPENEAHCVIPELCAEAKKVRKSWVLEITTALADNVICVSGPYSGQS